MTADMYVRDVENNAMARMLRAMDKKVAQSERDNVLLNRRVGDLVQINNQQQKEIEELEEKLDLQKESTNEHLVLAKLRELV